MVKLGFALDVVDEWPPIATEYVWCNELDGEFELLSPPVYIKGLACGDRFTAMPDPVNSLVFEFVVTKESGNSLIWIMNDNEAQFKEFEASFNVLKCSIVRFDEFNHFSIHVPKEVDSLAINLLANRLEEAGLAVAFPVWRHDAETA
ncbi:DUF4265 domain-containing protein [Chitinibacter sp. ZOR0017]|uniref:DUF4265 domain-containing protein n=1 Tax=Chitinibacter sp. ZOR0017 TaxID=1339254 RepID=UPI000648F0A7|nr:DUF4265 domain-containing protein [Chitinibacter sp. ZOR0017]